MSGRFWRAILLTGLAAAGCRTAPVAPLDLNAPGWRMRQGQMVWQAKPGAPEIAGELVVATHPPAESFLQFSKTPIPFVTAETRTNGWRIEFTPENRRYARTGHPPKQLIWLWLSPLLMGSGTAPNSAWEFTSQTANHGWVLVNKHTGERFEGDLPAP